MERRRIIAILVALVLGTLAGFLAGIASVGLAGILLPADLDGATRRAILTLVGYAAWAVAALAASAVWLHRRAHVR